MSNKQRLFKSATWTPHVVCPACQAKKVLTYKTMPAESAARVRFHKCRVCAALFKSVESFEAVP